MQLSVSIAAVELRMVASLLKLPTPHLDVIVLSVLLLCKLSSEKLRANPSCGNGRRSWELGVGKT